MIGQSPKALGFPHDNIQRCASFHCAFEKVSYYYIHSKWSWQKWIVRRKMGKVTLPFLRYKVAKGLKASTLAI